MREGEVAVIERKEAKGDKINCDYLLESRHLTALSDSGGETNGAYNFALQKDNLSLLPQPSLEPGGIWACGGSNRTLSTAPEGASTCYFSLQVP